MSFSKLVGFEDYQKWVVNNAEILSQVETLGRMASYLIAGRIKSSPAFSEFLYSITNIIIFLNDQILLRATQHTFSEAVPKTNLEKFRTLYTIIEYLQVFLEITAVKLWGSYGKWTVIAAIQTIKFLWRIVMVVTKQTGLSTSRPIPPLNRKKLRQENTFHNKCGTELSKTSNPTFLLKSGRIIRQVNGAPDIHKRNWKLPVTHQQPENVTKTKLEGYPLLGEVLYIIKPLCHLAAIGRFGSTSWIPWSLSLVMDVSSLKLLRLNYSNSEDIKEIRRRQLTLLMYLLRSPFYDTFSRKVVLQTLTALRTIPLIGVLPHHILQYMLFWQRIYFYTWD